MQLRKAPLKKAPAPRKAPKKFDPTLPVIAFQRLRRELKDEYFEMDTEVDLLLSALVARGHVFLGGPPGTAKSSLVRSVTGALDGAERFRILMTKFTLPEELFGVNSLAGIKDGTYKRITTGMLPEAEVAFVDEVFKASSAILNALLTIMEEREFRNGTAIEPCPLITMVGASNETPESTELAALYDRFLFRTWTSYIADQENFKDMMMGGDIIVTATISQRELEGAWKIVENMTITPEVIQGILDLKDAALVAGFSASDRRWKASIQALKAWAFIHGAAAVGPEHLEIYTHILWNEPKDIPTLAKLVAKVANPAAEACQAVLDVCREEYRKIPFDGFESRDPRQLFGEVQDSTKIFRDAMSKLEFDFGPENASVVKTVEQLDRWVREVSRLAAKVRAIL